MMRISEICVYSVEVGYWRSDPINGRRVGWLVKKTIKFFFVENYVRIAIEKLVFGFNAG